MKKLNWKLEKRFLLAFAIFSIIMIALPLVVNKTYWQHIFILSLVWMINAMSWNLISGYAGQVSNGQGMFYGIGAYTSALGMYYWNLPPWLTIWIAMLIAAGTAYVVGKPLLRLRGFYFVVATMATAECVRIIFINWPWVGGATGVLFRRTNLPSWYTWQFKEKLPTYYILLIAVLVVLLFMKVIDQSKFGYYLRTIKANETTAQSVGINTSLYKQIAFVISAMITSLGGAIYSCYLQYVDASMTMIMSVSMMFALCVVMGGLGTVFGPVIGAFVITLISEYSRAEFGNVPGVHLIIYGVVVIIILLWMPGGILSLAEDKKIKRLIKHFTRKNDTSINSEAAQ